MTNKLNPNLHRVNPPTISNTNNHVIIVAGEASGDLHGSKLVKAMLARNPNLHFSGIGGKELSDSGVEIIFPASQIAVVGFFEVISHLRDIFSARQKLIRQMKHQRPALLILIDFPDFNLLLAAKAKKMGIPVFYYISPQVWAWRSGRVKKIGRLTDTVGVILPFEKQFYQDRGVEVEFVGHPLMDSVKTCMSKKEFLKKHSITEKALVIGLLPGSRTKEIRSLLPIFLKAAELLQGQLDQKIVFLLPRASTVSKDLLHKNGLDKYQDLLDIQVISDNRYDLMASCDCVVTASGTVTLELAILGTPQVTTYKVSPHTYTLGKILIDVEFFSLVNLIAGKEVIRELLQDDVTPDNIAGELKELVTDQKKRTNMLQELEEVRKKIGDPGASARAAELATSLIGR